MLFQDDEKGHVIIGEAALSLALSEKEINVFSLITELGYMAKADNSSTRHAQIIEACNWLKNVSVTETGHQHMPHLQTLAGLNEEKN